MLQKTIAGGTVHPVRSSRAAVQRTRAKGASATSNGVHKMPEDLRKAIASSAPVRALWEDITPLARNEWICRVTSAKKIETRGTRIEKALSKMKGGMRRPCCWAGCVHR